MSLWKNLFTSAAAALPQAAEAVRKIEMPTDPVQDTKAAVTEITAEAQARHWAAFNRAIAGRTVGPREWDEDRVPKYTEEIKAKRSTGIPELEILRGFGGNLEFNQRCRALMESIAYVAIGFYRRAVTDSDLERLADEAEMLYGHPEAKLTENLEAMTKAESVAALETVSDSSPRYIEPPEPEYSARYLCRKCGAGFVVSCNCPDCGANAGLQFEAKNVLPKPLDLPPVSGWYKCERMSGPAVCLVEVDAFRVVATFFDLGGRRSFTRFIHGSEAEAVWRAIDGSSVHLSHFERIL